MTAQAAAHERMSKESIRAAHDVPAVIGRGLLERVRELGLETNIAELDIDGYTVVENALTSSEVDELRAGILELAAREEREGKRTFSFGPHTRVLYSVMGSIPAAERAVLHPSLRCLTTYLLGDAHNLSLCTGSVFSEGSMAGPIHDDNEFHPEPFPVWCATATAIWCLDDFNEETGATHAVPGSHRLRRHPIPGEGEDRVRVTNAPAGSFILWNGALWHSSGARKAPGERVAMHTAFCRLHFMAMQSYSFVPESVIERNPPEFARLLGRDLPYGFTTEGPRVKKLARAKALAEASSIR